MNIQQLLACFGAPAFSPSVLNPVVWLDATKLLLSDGGAVTAFTDQSGNGNDFTQSDATKKPTYTAVAINGLPAVLGDGAKSIMLSPKIPAATAFWGVIVVKPVTNGGANIELWAPSSFPEALSDTPSTYVLLEPNSGMVGINTSGASFGTSAIPIANGVTSAYLFQWGAAVALQDNLGNTLNSVTCLGTGRPDEIMSLFARNDGNLFFGGYVGELIYGAGTLTTDQIAALWKYLGTKWGFTHP